MPGLGMNRTLRQPPPGRFRLHLPGCQDFTARAARLVLFRLRGCLSEYPHANRGLGSGAGGARLSAARGPLRCPGGASPVLMNLRCGSLYCLAWTATVLVLERGKPEDSMSAVHGTDYSHVELYPLML